MSMNVKTDMVEPNNPIYIRNLRDKLTIEALTRKIFYTLKPFIPRPLQIWARQYLVSFLRRRNVDVWPIDQAAKSPPQGWPGWPDNKRFAVVLKHDVEWAGGQAKVQKVMEMEQSFGFRSSFNFVPLRYDVSPEVRQMLVNQGFEVGVHGLRHDGKLFYSKKAFEKRAYRINQYLEDWQATGFYAPASHHQLDWMHCLNIEYDSSTFDTDPFEPQPDPVTTIFPFWVANPDGPGGYIELPYTLVQDFTLFILMKEPGIDIWKEKIAWVAEHGGMVMLNTHPDYMTFDPKEKGQELYPAQHYADLLEHIKTEYEGQFWQPLPREVAAYCKQS